MHLNTLELLEALIERKLLEKNIEQADDVSKARFCCLVKRIG